MTKRRAMSDVDLPTLEELDALERDLESIGPGSRLDPELIEAAEAGDPNARSRVEALREIDPDGVGRYEAAFRAVQSDPTIRAPSLPKYYMDVLAGLAVPSLRLAALRPRAEEHVARTSWQRRSLIWMTSAAALAAGIALATFQLNPHGPDGVFLASVQGDVASAHRDEAAAAWVTLELTQVLEVSGAKMQWARAYQRGPGGVLSAPLRAVSRAWESDRLRHIELQIEVASLDVVEGQHVMLDLAIAGAGRSEESFEGLTIEDARRADGITWLEADLKKPLTSESGTLLDYEYRRSSDRGSTFGYPSNRPPRVRVRGTNSEQWGLSIDSQPVAVERVERGSWILLSPKVWPPPRTDATLSLTRSTRDVVRWSLDLFDPAVEIPELADEWRECAAYRNACLRGARRLMANLPDVYSIVSVWKLREAGRLAYRGGEYELAREAWGRAAESALALGIESEASARLRSLGYLDLEAGAYERARAQIQRALALDEALGNEKGVARALYLLALLAERADVLMTYLDARDRYERALESAYSRGDDGDAALFASMLATLLAEYGDYSEAQRILSENPAPPDTSPDQAAFLASNALTASVVARSTGQSTEPLGELLRRARRMQRVALDLGSVRLIAYQSALLAQIALQAGALDAAEAALAVTNELPMVSLGPSRYDLELARIDLALRRGVSDGLATRLDELDSALLEIHGGDSDRSVAVTGLRARLAAGRGDWDAAADLHEQAVRRAERLRARLSSPSARALYGWRLGASRAAALEILLEQGRTVEAFSFVEQGRQAELDELDAQLSAAGLRPVGGMKVDLRRGGSACTSRAPGQSETCESIRRARGEANDELYAQSRVVRSDPLPAGLWFQRVQRALEPGEGLLSMADGEER